MEKFSCIMRTQNFYFYLPKSFEQILKHKIEFIIKHNEALVENKIKNEIEQLLSKYKHGNDIHENGKQENK